MIFLPESPKYLVKRKKYHQAFLVLKKIWQTNGKKCSDKRIDDDSVEVTIEELLKRDDTDFELKNSSIAQKFHTVTNEETNQKNSQNQGVFEFVFKSQGNFIQTIFHTLIWFSATLTYFGKYFSILKFITKNLIILPNFYF